MGGLTDRLWSVRREGLDDKDQILFLGATLIHLSAADMRGAALVVFGEGRLKEEDAFPQTFQS